MLRGLIAFCLLRRPLVLVAFGAFLGLGFVAFTALNIEVYPDPAPPIIVLPFHTMPSRPILHAWANTVGPSPSNR